jgi:hypothetical protein
LLNTLGLPAAAAYGCAIKGGSSGRRYVSIGPQHSGDRAPDLADLIAYAKDCGAKVILAGDVGQLPAVENGGGM